jgi:hypothetical protein
MEEPFKCAEKTAEEEQQKEENLKRAIEDDSDSYDDSSEEDEDDNKAYPYKQSCNMFSSVGCLRCNPGYYVDGMECKKCNKECATCIDGNSCTTCSNGNMTAINGECIPTHSVSPNCRQLLPNGAGCAFCDDGYYRNSTHCDKCPPSLNIIIFDRSSKILHNKSICLLSFSIHFLSEQIAILLNPNKLISCSLICCFSDSNTFNLYF